MDELISKVLLKISSKEFQLQNLRQLLCEEIQFTTKGVYELVLENSCIRDIDLYGLMSFLHQDGSECCQQALESVIKFYSSNQLRMTFQQFQCLFLVREDKLLQKLTRQREKVEELPPFLQNYCRKIIRIEEQLHSEVIKYQHKDLKKVRQKLEEFRRGQYVNEEQLKECFLSQYHHSSEQCPNISFTLALRYLKHGREDAPLYFETFLPIFLPQNSNIIQKYLFQKEESFNKKLKPNTNPYLHKTFKKLQPHTQTLPYCFREIKSVENHIKRARNQPATKRMQKKLAAFNQNLVLQFTKFFRSVLKMIKINTEITKIKEEILLCYDCQFGKLFRQISYSKYIVPSELQNYLQNVGISIKTSELFILFKKYGDPLTGKINRKGFISIFGQDHSLKNNQNIDSLFRAATLTVLLQEIKLQLRIEKIKRELCDEVNLRQIFDGMDLDKRSQISRTDFEVTFCRITNQKIKESQLQMLWKRMNKKLTSYVTYDEFMFQMLPKIKKRPRKANSLARV